MSYRSILEYIHSLAKIYFKASKKDKGKMLDHATQVTGLHRKSLMRLLKNQKEFLNGKKRCGARVKYSSDLLLPHIEYLWVEIGKLSVKRMKAAYIDWLPPYNENGVTNNIKFLLQKMSSTTLGRFLKKIRENQEQKSRGLCSTHPAQYMQNKVPINTLDSTVTREGYIQADTVAHCGTKLEGNFISSLTLTDIHSTWTANRALYTKKGPIVKKALNHMIDNLPFDILAINTDSGSEFLNIPVYNNFQKKKITFTRSRPYKKNDNCYVEQKNYTHTRELFGYQRFDDHDLVRLMNDIYENYWNPLLNFFIPTFKIKEKIRIGGRIKKKYGPPITPYQRLMDSNNISEKKKIELAEQKKKLNPFELKKELDRKLQHFFNVVIELEKLKNRGPL